MKDNESSPKVSIITPSYNQAAYLEKTICSVLEQNYHVIEYIIMDGGSIDSSNTIIESYANRLAYWESQPDRGQSHAINKGITKSTGDIIGWINSDDTLEPQAVSRVVEAFINNPDIDLVYGDVNRIDQAGELLRSANEKAYPDFSTSTMLSITNLSQPGSFWRRSIMDRVGGLDSSFHHVMDYEFWIRIVLAGGNIIRIPPPPIANFRLSPNTKTVSQLDQSGLETLRLFDHLIANENLINKLISLGMEEKEVLRQLSIGRSNAGLKIFISLSSKSNTPYDSLKWLKYSIQNNSSFVWSKYRLVIKGLLNIFHISKRRKAFTV